MDVARPAHLGAFVPLLARLDAIVEAASTTFLRAVQQPGFSCGKQPKQQTKRGSKQYKHTTAQQPRPGVEHTGLTFQRDDDDFEPTCAPRPENDD